VTSEDVLKEWRLWATFFNEIGSSFSTSCLVAYVQDFAMQGKVEVSIYFGPGRILTAFCSILNLKCYFTAEMEPGQDF